MSKIDRLKQAIENSGLSYVELEKRTHIPKSSIQRYASGTTRKIPLDAMEAIAKATGVSAAWIMGWSDETSENSTSPDYSAFPNLIPLPKYKKIPLLGDIACGEPILADQNIEEYLKCPEDVDADFCLRCKGDSMIGARIHDGDIVYIRQQPTVENGKIAAVLIDNEATLKRVFIENDRVILQPENSAYSPLIFIKEEMNQVRIIGTAVCFISRVK